MRLPSTRTSNANHRRKRVVLGLAGGAGLVSGYFAMTMFERPAPAGASEKRMAVGNGVGAPPNPYLSYTNCAAARKAGAAPVRVGDPGYSTRLDRDGDGVGCE